LACGRGLRPSAACVPWARVRAGWAIQHLSLRCARPPGACPAELEMRPVSHRRLPGLGLSESCGAGGCMTSRAVSEHAAWPAQVRPGLSRYEWHERLPGLGRVRVVPGTRVPSVPGPHPSVRPCPYLRAAAVARGGASGGSAGRGGRQWARLGAGEGDVVAWRVGMSIRVARGTVAVTGPSRVARAGAGGDAGDGRRGRSARASRSCSD
jgi:hypothetical protein